jgi:hypothetical protein
VKYRKGFVTNSSSSSYIVAYKDISKEMDDAHKNYANVLVKAFENNITRVANDWYSSEEGYIMGNKQEVDEYFMSRYAGHDENTMEEVFENNKNDYDYDYMVDMYNSIMEYINKGYKVLTKYVDRIDEEFQEFINEAIDGENVILVSKKAD